MPEPTDPSTTPRLPKRRSPPTDRVVQALNLFASDPSVAMTLSTVSRELGLNSSTCLGILNELAHAGYLTREHRSGAYRLGPAVLRLGLAAAEARPILRAIQQQVERLSEQLGVDCGATTVEEGRIVVVDLVRAPDQTRDSRLNIGVQYPFAAPTGVHHIAWDTDEAVQAWLDRGVPLPPEEVERLWAVIESSRAAGYLVRGLTPLDVMLNEAFHQAANGARWYDLQPRLLTYLDGTHEEFLHRDISDDGQYPISFVCAPARDRTGYPQHILYARLMRQDVSGREITDAGRRLLEACRAVERQMVG